MKNKTFKKLLATIVLLSTLNIAFAQDVVVDSTKYDGVLKGTLTSNTLIKTVNFHYYVIDDNASVKINMTNPEVLVTKNGKKLFIKIQGAEKALKCHKEDDVYDKNIVDAFRGWTGDTKIKLDDGTEWQQDAPGMTMANLYRPKAIVYKTNDGYRVKIQGVDELMLVKKVN